MAILNKDTIRIEYYKEHDDGTTEKTGEKTVNVLWKDKIEKYDTRFHEKYQDDFTEKYATFSVNKRSVYQNIRDNRKLITIYHKPCGAETESVYHIVDFENYQIIGGGRFYCCEGGYQ